MKYLGGLLVIVVLAFVATYIFPAQAAQCGIASWYGPGFHGKKTASGQKFNENAMTAAHRSLPFGTRVIVVDQNTGKSVKVTITDRGPFKRGRIIDLSKHAASRLGIQNAGTAHVCIKA